MRQSRRRKLLSQDVLSVDDVLALDGLSLPVAEGAESSRSVPFNHPSQYVPFAQWDAIAAAYRILEET